VIKAAVVGAAGYAGIEAVRLVLGHPELELALVTSGADEGKAVADVYPALAGLTEARFEAPDALAIAQVADIAFLAVPHTAALALAPTLVQRGVKVVDLSADFRLQDAAVYERWYEVEHTAPDLLARAVYGLPELDRANLAGAEIVAGPGCYPTAALLAVLPALRAGLATTDRFVVDAKSGVSGAGRSAGAGTHYCAVDESLAPYKVAAHRHTPEIEQSFSVAASSAAHVTFVPHLVPMNRGLLATVYIEVDEALSAHEVHEIYCSHYADEPFVFVRPLGEWPATSHVAGSNRAHVGVTVDERTNTLVAACAIDNLVKGAAGQAVQCANLVLGLLETLGLDAPMPVV
jgi:N-acetyl-gamma-glutamyl-phosphate reductase